MPRHDKQRYANKFIEKSNKKHNFLYSYDKVEYIDSYTHVVITCPFHGDFKQSPSNHSRGTKCPKCANIGRNKTTTADFVKHSIEVHGDKYDYSMVDYFHSRTPIVVICPQHGDFTKLPYQHLQGLGCRKCAIENMSYDLDHFISMAEEKHGDLYDYSMVEYKGWNVDVIIGCSVHGHFKQKPTVHIKGYGCSRCGYAKSSKERIKIASNGFIEKARKVHGGKYNYTKVEYIGSHEKITIICPAHGEFDQIPYSHLNSRGCPQCSSAKKTKEEISNMSDEEKNFPHYLYHARFSREGIESFDKIGVTCHADIITRFRYIDYKDYDIEIIAHKEGRKEDILLEESEILIEMERNGARYHLHDLKHSFGGWTECFPPNAFDPSPYFAP